MLSSETINQAMSLRMAPLRNKTDHNKLLVHEIYCSIQGESSYMGKPCVFVRTTGCHLRCSYCDTEQAFFQGRELELENILEQVASYKINLVELTGGEPLLQPASFILLDKLIKQNHTVLLETSGAVSIRNINSQVKIILDIKTPSSGEHKKFVKSNLDYLNPNCEIKFVISSLEDYIFARDFCWENKLFNHATKQDFNNINNHACKNNFEHSSEQLEILFSPVVSKIDPKYLVELILKDKLPVRFQLQLHRVLYGEQTGV